MQATSGSVQSTSDSSGGMTRRRFLRHLGIGAGTVAIVAGGGVAWRLVDQSILAPGTGPAYAPWDADPDDPSPLGLVSAAVLAANAHNTQPWLFAVAPDRIDLFADRTRSMGTMDPLGREMLLSLGCALENLVVAAQAHGFEPTVTLLPTPAEPDHVASVALAPAAARDDALYRAIPRRHTNRGAYDIDRPVDVATLDELRRLGDDPTVGLAWLTSDEDKRRFGQLTVDATAAILADPDQARDDFAWYRQDWREIQRLRDGITMDASGLGEPMRTIVRLLPASSQTQMQEGWLGSTRDRHVATASAYGLVLAADQADPGQLLRAGRLFQRIHLSATDRGIAVQPLNQVNERVDREMTADAGTTFASALDDLTPDGWRTVMAFRVGYPLSEPARSPRRSVESVVQG